MKKENTKHTFTVRLSEEAANLCIAGIAMDDCRSRNEFIEKAIKYYTGYLSAEKNKNDKDEKIDLRKVQKEAVEYQGRIWNFVVSLKREDAQRLGYDNAKVWRNLVIQKSLAMAKEMRIKPENLIWYGAFHNESHHPHIHIMCYSRDPKEGYLTKKGIENLRSAFAHEIFHDEFYHLYEQKDALRKYIREEC